MGAKETAMSLDALNLWSRAWHIENGVSELYQKADFISGEELAKLQHQAEISFKAGEKLSLEKQGQAYLEGKQAGIKEVVEWGEQTCNNHNLIIGDRFALCRECPECWQSKKKGWGI